LVTLGRPVACHPLRGLQVNLEVLGRELPDVPIKDGVPVILGLAERGRRGRELVLLQDFHRLLLYGLPHSSAQRSAEPSRSEGDDRQVVKELGVISPLSDLLYP